MSTPDTADQAWAMLADLGEDERRQQMEARYVALTVLPEEERRARLKVMARVEYTLPEDKLRPFFLSKLRVWLGMDSEVVQKVAASDEAIMDELPGEIAMRRVGVVQTLARSFSLTEQEQLRAVLPRVFGDRGTATASWEPSRGSGLHSQGRAKKPWWAFWRKG